MSTDDEALARASTRYVDELFGPGMGQRHRAYLRYLWHPELRATMDRYHVLEADTRYLSVADNYLLGMTVLAALRSYDTAAIFAKILLHLGEPPQRLLEAIARLSMWTGGIPAAEAAAHIQKAILQYQKRGLDSLSDWFPAQEETQP